jgi:hypothetical protein
VSTDVWQVWSVVKLDGSCMPVASGSQADAEKSAAERNEVASRMMCGSDVFFVALPPGTVPSPEVKVLVAERPQCQYRSIRLAAPSADQPERLVLILEPVTGQPVSVQVTSADLAELRITLATSPLTSDVLLSGLVGLRTFLDADRSIQDSVWRNLSPELRQSLRSFVLTASASPAGEPAQ